MHSHTLYAYVLAEEFPFNAKAIENRTMAFISSHEWKCPDCWAVNQTSENATFELGLNMALPEPNQEPLGWYQDVEAVVQFCSELRREFSYDFVIGISNKSGMSEDIIEIDSDSPNLEYLRKFIGVGNQC